MSSSSDLLQSVPDAVLAKAAATTTIGGGGIAVIGSYALNEVAMIVGIIVGLAGVVIQLVVAAHNIWLRHRQDKRAAALNKAKIDALHKGHSLRDVESVETTYGGL